VGAPADDPSHSDSAGSLPTRNASVRDLRHGPISRPSQTGESRHDALPIHAAHSQGTTGARLVAPARLIPHPPKVCRLLQPTREALPPTSSLLPVWTVRSITSGATRVPPCARVSAERGLPSNNFRQAPWNSTRSWGSNERRTGPAFASPFGGAIRAGEEPRRAACCATLERLWPRTFSFQIENLGSDHPSRAETPAEGRSTESA
jgi:hypothetical protein